MNIGLVWASNVGKSTLFNRLIGQFRAIVTDIPGTTRDIIHHETVIEWIGEVIFSDSPGLLDFKDELIYIKNIIDISDLLLFVIDDKAGITAKEQHIADYIRKKNKQNQTLLVVNKLDLRRKAGETSLALSDYHGFGFKHIVGVSAKNARNMEEVQEWIVKNKKGEKDIKKEKKTSIGLAIVGKPNVGKSTFLNTITGKKLSKVENVPGTTRDYIIGDIICDKHEYRLYDTAGIKKKASMHDIEKIAYTKTLDMLKFLRPIVIFLIDATESISHRDMTLLQEINNFGLPVIIGLNKTDLLTEKEIKRMSEQVQAYMEFARYIPIVPIVATTGKWIKNIMNMVPLISKEMNKRIDTNKLNTLLGKEFISRPPRFPKNKICKILYVTQTDINAPTFLVFVNHKERANFAFRRWIDNVFRKHFGFIGTPLVIRFKSRNEKEKNLPQEERREEQRKSKYEEKIGRYKTKSAIRKK